MFTQSLWQRLQGWFWFVHVPVVLIVNATPAVCLQTLIEAARPSTQRLHHRNLFASGRRYEFRMIDDSESNGAFRMTTTSKVSWHYRRRTSSSAVLIGKFYTMTDEMTRIQLETRIKLLYLLDVFLIPTFMTSIIVFVPWSNAVIVGLIALFYLLSWVAHRYNAAYEANEMIYFVQKVLEDLATGEMKSLETGKDVVYQDFERVWEKFYQEHREDPAK
ncbi:MAG: hypothetical protein MUF87_03675 [Anaerolineae bacterium]|jgi:hypothetical protein|nr:hypothetical protein [Anaerolineae bacterium]